MLGRLGVLFGLEARYCINISRACLEACLNVELEAALKA
jgi:hypothetical protein